MKYILFGIKETVVSSVYLAQINIEYDFYQNMMECEYVIYLKALWMNYTYSKTAGQSERWLDYWMDGEMDEWIDGRMGEWLVGWNNTIKWAGQIYVYIARERERERGGSVL